jgi:hypothetical protein
MLGHMGVNVQHLAQAKAYYDSLMPLLDFEPYLSAADNLPIARLVASREPICSFIRPWRERATRATDPASSIWRLWSGHGRQCIPCMPRSRNLGLL